MKKFFTVLIFCLISNSALAKEYIMTCDDTTWKFINNFFSKKIYTRQDAKWKEYCTKGRIIKRTIEIYEDGAKCTFQREEKKGFVNGKWFHQKQFHVVNTLDFHLKTQTINNFVYGTKKITMCN